jgi:hypothetical protein
MPNLTVLKANATAAMDKTNSPRPDATAIVLATRGYATVFSQTVSGGDVMRGMLYWRSYGDLERRNFYAFLGPADFAAVSRRELCPWRRASARIAWPSARC